MSINFFPTETEEDISPRYKSTALVRGILADPGLGTGILGTTGTFTLWYEGVPIVVNRVMPVDVSLGQGWCSCRILHTELAQHGLYQWEMVLTSPDTLWVLTDTGDFTL
jgi:hypothetical protein